LVTRRQPPSLRHTARASTVTILIIQAVVQFFRGQPTVPGGYPQQFHHLIPVRV